MNKVFTFRATSMCDGCGYREPEGTVPYFAVLTAEDGVTGNPIFFSFKQFCSEGCREKFVIELNSINGGFLAFGYEVVKG